MTEKQGNIVKYILGIAASMSAIFALLITSFQIAAYSDFDYYEEEYKKYNVTESLQMEMKDVMEVTHYMMDYLIGREEVLSIETKVAGEERDFFQEQDRLHMEDVQNLFLGGLTLRMYALCFMAVCIGLLLILKADMKKILPGTWLIGIGIYGVLTVILGICFAVDFSAAFTRFHEIFFTNDLWMFDPATDLMINMLPQGFFFDMVIRIGKFFIGGMLVLTAICAGVLVWEKKQVNKTKISSDYK